MDDDYREEISGEDLKGLQVYRRRPVTTFFGKDFDGGITGLNRGLYFGNGKMQKVLKAIVAGVTNSECRRRTGASLYTISKARKMLEITSGKVFLCQCGLPVTHKKMCAFRKANSPRYLAHLEKLRKAMMGKGSKAIGKS